VAAENALYFTTVPHFRKGGPEVAINQLRPDGNLFVCRPGGIWVLSADGRRLGTIRPPEAPPNLACGDDDGRTLYITALTSVYRIRLTN
jgi:gluconolactonase